MGMHPVNVFFLRIPKPRIPDSTGKNFPDSGILSPLHGEKKNNALAASLISILCEKIISVNRSLRLKMVLGNYFLVL